MLSDTDAVFQSAEVSPFVFFAAAPPFIQHKAACRSGSLSAVIQPVQGGTRAGEGEGGIEE